MAAEYDGPDEDVARHPLARGELLQTQGLGPFEDEVGEVEDGAEPANGGQKVRDGMGAGSLVLSGREVGIGLRGERVSPCVSHWSARS